MARIRAVALLFLTALLAACALESRGPWVDASGRRMQGSEVIEFEGFAECDQRSVVFLRFFGDQYAKDPEGRLGDLSSPLDGDPLTYEVLEAGPADARGTGITHGGREILVGEDREDYLYVRLADGRVERWPRAEVECDL